MPRTTITPIATPPARTAPAAPADRDGSAAPVAAADVAPAPLDAVTAADPAAPAAADFARSSAGADVGSVRFAPAFARSAEPPRPIDPSLYRSILDEAARADWRDCGIDPKRYVEERISKERVLDVLRANPDVKITLHRGAIKLSQAGFVDSTRCLPAFHDHPRDYPGAVYWQAHDRSLHLIGLVGEDWFRQTLYMLAVEGIPGRQILVEGSDRLDQILARELGPTLDQHRFASVTVGTVGELTQGLERVLADRGRPAYAVKVFGKMQALLDRQLAEAKPAKRPRWEERRARLARIAAQTGDATERMKLIMADPVLTGPLGELLKAYRDGPPFRELPWTVINLRRPLFSHRVIEMAGKKHLILHVGGAHGDLARAGVEYALRRQPTIGRVNVFGSAGSFSDDLPPDTVILPRGAIASAESDRPPIPIDNKAVIPGAQAVRHSNVSTLLREHRAGLEAMRRTPAETVDMEGYHVAAAVAAAGRPVELRAVFRVSDVATSSDLGAHRADRGATSDYAKRRLVDEQVASLFFLDGTGD
ncbi:MAG: hypothetical protein JXR83_03840 [Deltaproteobacteria bacterium]|nr:hypothetical protein [Deltaproteobacteria bacterium]